MSHQHLRSSLLANPGSIGRRSFIVGVATAAAASAVSAQESWPTRPLRLIVPFAPGGTADVVARLIATRLGEGLGQTVVVENRGGAGSLIGTDLGAKAAPDGYTLTLSNGAAVTVAPLLGQKLPYHPLDDFTHVHLIGAFANMLVVRAENPARNLSEFIENARKSPKGLSWASAGVGSAGHLSGELLQQVGKFQMVHVPYKGTGPAMNDLLGGSLDAMLTSPAVAASQIRAGKLRALAVSGAQRLADFPDIPTMNEIVPGSVGEAWFGISVPAKTPKPVVERLRVGLDRVMAAPAVRAQLQQAGLTPLGLGPEQFDKYIQDEIAKWGPVIKAARITVE